MTVIRRIPPMSHGVAENDDRYARVFIRLLGTSNRPSIIWTWSDAS